MKRFVLSATALLAATVAVADPGPLDGRWALWKDVCTNAENMGDIVPTVIEGNSILHYESACTITDISPIGNQEAAWRVKAECSGEGEKWSTESIYAIDNDPNGNPRQLVEVDMLEGYVIVYQHCD